MKQIKIYTSLDVIDISVERIPKKGERIYLNGIFYVVTEFTTFFGEKEIYELIVKKLC